MITYGALNPIDQIPVPPDTIQTLSVEASSGQALDWASTLAQLVRFTGISTAGVALNFWVDLNTTGAAVPSSGNSTGDVSIPVIGSRVLQIPGGSTGWSAATLSSGFIQAELWRK